MPYALYFTIRHLHKENLQFNPRIRGKNKQNKQDIEENKTTVDLGELYNFLLDSFHTRENVQEYVKQVVKEKLEQSINDILNKIKKS